MVEGVTHGSQLLLIKGHAFSRYLTICFVTQLKIGKLCAETAVAMFATAKKNFKKKVLGLNVMTCIPAKVMAVLVQWFSLNICDKVKKYIYKVTKTLIMLISF